MNIQSWKVVQYSERDWRIARLAALATLVHVLEAAFPSPLPGIKPGLANVITILAFFELGLGAAIWVSLLRVVAGSLLIGTFLSPGFALSLAGATASLLVLVVLAPLRGWGLGPLGVSVLASMAHVGGQFLLAYTLLIPHDALLDLLPVLLAAAMLFGIVSGLIANRVMDRMRKIQ